MGGTRLIGVALLPRLLAAGHAVTVFSRGRRPVPAGVEHVRGDRQSPEDLRQLAESQQVIAHTGWPGHRFLEEHLGLWWSQTETGRPSATGHLEMTIAVLELTHLVH